MGDVLGDVMGDVSWERDMLLRIRRRQNQDIHRVATAVPTRCRSDFAVTRGSEARGAGAAR